MLRSLVTICCLGGFALLRMVQETGAAELPARAATPGTYTLTIMVDGIERLAHVHVPAGYNDQQPPPLVLVFHGAGGNGLMMLDRNGWIAKADQQGFVVVAPDGLPALPRQAPDFRGNPTLWNSGQLKSITPRARIDDVRFTAKLLDELQQRVPYHAKQVFATGHSNGAGMVFRLGTELSDRLAALAPVAGSMALKDPQPARPLPTLFIVGTKDPMQPLEGGVVTLPWGVPETRGPVADYLKQWAKASGCSEKPTILDEANGVKTVEYASKQTDGATLKVIYLEGHGHEWAGGQPRRLARRPASKPTTFNATDAVWEFFASQIPSTDAAQ